MKHLKRTKIKTPNGKLSLATILGVDVVSHKSEVALESTDFKKTIEALGNPLVGVDVVAKQFREEFYGAQKVDKRVMESRNEMFMASTVLARKVAHFNDVRPRKSLRNLFKKKSDTATATPLSFNLDFKTATLTDRSITVSDLGGFKKMDMFNSFEKLSAGVNFKISPEEGKDQSATLKIDKPGVLRISIDGGNFQILQGIS